MDLDLIQGIAEGAKETVGAYKDYRKEAEDKALRKRLQQIQYLQAGLTETPEGNIAFTPEKQEERNLGLLKTKAETQKLLAEAGQKGSGLENELKKVQLAKAKKELEEGKKPTSNEFAAAGYAKRLQQAEDVFKNVAESDFDPTSAKAMAQKMIPGFLGNLKPVPLQLQEQAERNFVNAVLRRESGAAISKDEFKSAEAQYFPRRGDSPELLRQKEINRQIVMNNLGAEAGRALDKTPDVKTLNAALPGGLLKKSKGLVGGQEAQAGGKIKVSNGKETLMIDPSDLADAQKDGFQVMK